MSRQYTLQIRLKDTGETYGYSLQLSYQQENNPQRIFTKELQENIRGSFQAESACKIDDYALTKIIKTWLGDIREGYTGTTITLDLPSILEAEIENLCDDGNQTIPDLPPPNPLVIEPLLGVLPPLIFT
jgi:hypothetical protein